MQWLLARADNTVLFYACNQDLFTLYCFIPCHWSSLHPFAALWYGMFDGAKKISLLIGTTGSCLCNKHWNEWQRRKKKIILFLIAVLWHLTQPLTWVSTKSLKKKYLWILFTYFSHQKLPLILLYRLAIVSLSHYSKVPSAFLFFPKI